MLKVREVALKEKLSYFGKKLRALIPRQMKKLHKQYLIFTCPFFIFLKILYIVIIFIWGQILLFVVRWGPPCFLCWIYICFDICLGCSFKLHYIIASANVWFYVSLYCPNFIIILTLQKKFQLLCLKWLFLYKVKSLFQSIPMTWNVISIEHPWICCYKENTWI